MRLVSKTEIQCPKSNNARPFTQSEDIPARAKPNNADTRGNLKPVSGSLLKKTRAGEFWTKHGRLMGTRKVIVTGQKRGVNTNKYANGASRLE
jgi:hypothetical protein